MQRDSKNVIFNYANDIQLKQEVAFLLRGKARLLIRKEILYVL